jgi:hypothetical protein
MEKPGGSSYRITPPLHATQNLIIRHRGVEAEPKNTSMCRSAGFFPLLDVKDIIRILASYLVAKLGKKLTTKRNLFLVLIYIISHWPGKT